MSVWTAGYSFIAVTAATAAPFSRRVASVYPLTTAEIAVLPVLPLLPEAPKCNLVQLSSGWLA